MKQIDYFKFLKAFPQLIDTNDPIEIKVALLQSLRKMTWRNKEFIKLLPISLHSTITPVDIKIEDFRKKGFNGNGYYIKYRNNKLLMITIINDQILFSRPQNYYIYMDYLLFMLEDEIKNLKRTVMIDNMLEK